MKWQFTITDSSSVATIVQEPIGFTEMSYTLRRNMNHHGVFKTIDTGALKYVGDAYTILNTEYDTNGANAASTLLIEYKCAEDDNWTTFFNGKFDFNTFSKTCSKYCYVECQVIANSCLDTFLSSVDTDINLDTTTSLSGDAITALTNYNLTIEGQDILLYDNANNNDELDSGGTQNVITTGTLSHLIMPIRFPNTPKNDFGNFNQNGYNPQFIQKNANAELPWDGTVTPPVISDSDWEDYMQFTSIYEPVVSELDCTSGIEATLYLNATVTVEPQFTCGLNDTYLVYKIYNKLTGTFKTFSFITIPSTAAIAPGGIATFNFSISDGSTFNLQQEEVLCLFLQFRFSGNSFPISADITINIDYNGTNSLQLFQNSSCAPTTTKAYILRDVFEWMPNAINDCYSSVCYADCFNAYQITNGLMIRNVTTPVMPKLFLSWSNLFKSINKIFNIGWGISGDGTQIIVDDVEGFYVNTPMIDLGSVSEVKFNHARDLTYGLINVGYTKWEAEEYSGLDEMNTMRQYKRNVNSNNTQLDLVSDFITAGYTIEITRRKNMPLTGTSDWRYDNDVFLINTNFADDHYEAYRGVDQDAANIISPTTRMNYRLTPIRTLMKWFKSIAAPTPDYTQEALAFNSGTGNYLATGKMLNDCSLELYALSENEIITSADFNDDSLAYPIWKAIYANFTCPLTIEQKAIMDDDPYGLVSFQCNGISHEGYLIECTYTPENGTANFKILLRNE